MKDLKILMLIMAVSLTILYSEKALSQTTVYLPLTDDAWIKGSEPDVNHGKHRRIAVGKYGPKEGLVRFDASPIAGRLVTKATLEVFLDDVREPGYLRLTAIASSWDEDTVTWNSRPTMDKLWASNWPTISEANERTVISFNVTSPAQRWADGSLPDAGLMIWGTATVALLHSKEKTGGTPPRLIVVTEPMPDEDSEHSGIMFPAGPISFADRVVSYEPAYYGGPVPKAIHQDARQVLGVPEQGGFSIGNGGRVTVRFLDNSLTGSGDSSPDLFVFEVGEPETTFVEISKDGINWYSVGLSTGMQGGIDIDQYGFNQTDAFSYVRLTDDGDTPGCCQIFGADINAVGAISSGLPVEPPPAIEYEIQAQISGTSQLVISGSTMQWHHKEGVAPGLALGDIGLAANAPTIIDSNQGPNVPWVPEGWPARLGDGTHSRSESDLFESLTPVFPAVDMCWKLEQLWGHGVAEIYQQPAAHNGYRLYVQFDDLGDGAVPELSGSGFYAIRLSPCD